MFSPPQLSFIRNEKVWLRRAGFESDCFFTLWLRMLSLAELISVRPSFPFFCIAVSLQAIPPPFSCSPFMLQSLLTGRILPFLLRAKSCFCPTPALSWDTLQSVAGGTLTPPCHSSVFLYLRLQAVFSRPNVRVALCCHMPLLSPFSFPPASHLFSDRWQRDCANSILGIGLRLAVTLQP